MYLVHGKETTTEDPMHIYLGPHLNYEKKHDTTFMLADLKPLCWTNSKGPKHIGFIPYWNIRKKIYHQGLSSLGP